MEEDGDLDVVGGMSGNVLEVGILVAFVLVYRSGGLGILEVAVAHEVDRFRGGELGKEEPNPGDEVDQGEDLPPDVPVEKKETPEYKEHALPKERIEERKPFDHRFESFNLGDEAEKAKSH